jgi:hypothetical protein
MLHDIRRCAHTHIELSSQHGQFQTARHAKQKKSHHRTRAQEPPAKARQAHFVGELVEAVLPIMRMALKIDQQIAD